MRHSDPEALSMLFANAANPDLDRALRLAESGAG